MNNRAARAIFYWSVLVGGFATGAAGCGSSSTGGGGGAGGTSSHGGSSGSAGSSTAGTGGGGGASSHGGTSGSAGSSTAGTGGGGAGGTSSHGGTSGGGSGPTDASPQWIQCGLPHWSAPDAGAAFGCVFSCQESIEAACAAPRKCGDTTWSAALADTSSCGTLEEFGTYTCGNYDVAFSWNADTGTSWLYDAGSGALVAILYESLPGTICSAGSADFTLPSCTVSRFQWSCLDAGVDRLEAGADAAP